MQKKRKMATAIEYIKKVWFKRQGQVPNGLLVLTSFWATPPKVTQRNSRKLCEY